MAIMKFNLNGCRRRNLRGCHKKPTLSGTVTIMGNTYNTDDVAWQGNYSFDSNGNMFADDNGSFWWGTTPNGSSFLTDGQEILYAVDSYGVQSVSKSFDWAGLGKGLSDLISTGANAYNAVANSKTAQSIQSILKNAGIISNNNSGSQSVAPTIYPSTNYTPFILGGLGLVALILILKR